VVVALLVVLAVAGVVVLALVVIGRATLRLRTSARPAVFDLEEAVDFIADRLDEGAAGRMTMDDVRWILRADVDLLEQATDDPDADGAEVVDEDGAVARILERADAEDRDLEDADIAAVLDGRSAYLEAIGAVGPQVAGPDDPGSGST
jgi:hypothetical protein